MQPPIAEEILIYVGQFLGIAVSVFIAMKVDRKSGLLFIIAWLLYNQLLFINYFDLIPESAESTGACWARLRDYYKCMPLIQRVSIHASQIGQVIIWLAIFMLGKKVILTRENS